jgi:hypothetical protein
MTRSELRRQRAQLKKTLFQRRTNTPFMAACQRHNRRRTNQGDLMSKAELRPVCAIGGGNTGGIGCRQAGPACSRHSILPQLSPVMEPSRRLLVIIAMSSQTEMQTEKSRKRAEASFRAQVREVEGKKAFHEYRSAQQAALERIPRLRALRLERDAQAKREAAPGVRNVKAKLKTKGGAKR